MIQTPPFLSRHPLGPNDAAALAAMRLKASSAKGLLRGAEARETFDAMMESVPPPVGVRFEDDTVGGIAGTWVHPSRARSGQVILYLHDGWFNLESARAYRNFVGHIATKVRARAFIPNYRLAPEDPFPAAVRDVHACYRCLE